MVHVRLEKQWTDADGNPHAAGDTVDVDAATLADLQQKGIVSEGEADWAGPTGGETTNWAGPTGTQP
jgi:hypothetical protein